MNIADFVKRGNPEEMDDDFEPIESVTTLSGKEKSEFKAENAQKRGPIPKNSLIIIAVLVLSSTASFGLGLLAQGQGSAANAGGLIVGASPSTKPSSATLSASALNATNSVAPGTGATSANGTPIPVGGEVIGDNSSHTYYLPWCSQATNISKADTVWFPTEQMAKSAGYTAGAHCPGI